MRFDFIIFDIDGVLIDVSQSYREAIRQSVKSISGKIVSNQDIQEMKKIPGFNNDWAVSYALSFGEKDPSKIDRTSEQYAEVKNTFQRIYKNQKLYEREIILINKVILEKLKLKAKLGIVTSRPREEALFALNKFIPEFFEEKLIIAQEDCDEEKPNPKPLLILKERTNSKNPVYVGDTINDQLAARSANMKFISITSELKADFYIKNVNKILKVIDDEK